MSPSTSLAPLGATPPAQTGMSADGARKAQLAPLSLTAPQKAALVIAALGPESAGPIIERIEDKHLRAFARAYAHLQKVPKAALKIVVEEFVGRLSKDDASISGGYEQTREMLSQFISGDEIIRLMDDIDAPGGQTIWERLERAPDAELANYLSKQNPQLVAVVLSKINTENASRLLDRLDDEIAQQVIVRLSRPMNVKRETLIILGETIERDFLAPLRQSSRRRNPGEMIGSMMNNVMSEKREGLLNFISENVPDILHDVKKSMLTFQDLSERVPAKAIPMVIKEMEINDFLQAAKFGRQNAPSSVEFIFANISQRMAQQYEEEMEKLKPISGEEAESAQAHFMSLVRRLAAAGEFELNEVKADDDEDEAEEAPAAEG